MTAENMTRSGFRTDFRQECLAALVRFPGRFKHSLYRYRQQNIMNGPQIFYRKSQRLNCDGGVDSVVVLVCVDQGSQSDVMSCDVLRCVVVRVWRSVLQRGEVCCGVALRCDVLRYVAVWWSAMQ